MKSFHRQGAKIAKKVEECGTKDVKAKIIIVFLGGLGVLAVKEVVF